MGMFERFIKTEERALENLNAPVSVDDFFYLLVLRISSSNKRSKCANSAKVRSVKVNARPPKPSDTFREV